MAVPQNGVRLSIVQALKSQIESLSAQVALNRTIHGEEIRRSREDNEGTVLAGITVQNRRIATLNAQTCENRQKGAKLCEKAQDLQTEIHSAQDAHELAAAAAAAEISELQKRVDENSLRVSRYTETELATIQQGMELEKARFLKFLRNSQEERAVFKADQESLLDSKETILHNLEKEVSRQRTKLRDLRSFTQNRLFPIENSLKVSELSLGSRKQEIASLKKCTTHLTNSSSVLLTEAALLNSEISRVRRENKSLRSKVDELSTLVYGKPAR